MPIDTFIFDSPDFWKAIAFVLSFAVVIFPLWRFCVNKLQLQNQKVILEFNEAVEKQKKADDELNEAKKKLENAEIERKQITKVAQKEIDTLKKNASLDMQAQMLRRQKENEERVCLIREKGLKQLQDKFLDIATETAKFVLSDTQILNNASLSKSSIDELQAVLADEKNVKLLKNKLMEEG